MMFSNKSKNHKTLTVHSNKVRLNFTEKLTDKWDLHLILGDNLIKKIYL